MTSTEEIWRPVTDWEDLYEVSNLGRVRSLDRLATNGRRYRGKLLTPVVDAFGYLMVCLSEGGKHKNGKIHRMVLRAFVGEPPAGMECGHLDGNKKNASLSNLAWITRIENARHRDKVHFQRNTSVGEALTQSTISTETARRIKETLLFGARPIDLQRLHQVSRSVVQKIHYGETWMHLGRPPMTGTVRAYTSAGTESANSNVVSKMVQ